MSKNEIIRFLSKVRLTFLKFFFFLFSTKILKIDEKESKYILCINANHEMSYYYALTSVSLFLGC